MTLAFLKEFQKSINKMDDIITDFSPPRFWASTGNLALNYILSGSFTKGLPQGRISCFAGPSGAGKSFLLCNSLKNAQADGAFILLLDSENALDKGWLRRIGMDISPEKFMYVGVTKFSDVTAVISEFVNMYEKEYGRSNFNAPRVVIALDSLDMLLTDTEDEHFNKGVQKGDQGQRSKQGKQMLRTISSRIKRNPMTFSFTHQVYPNTDLMNGLGLWIINNACRYSASQIALIVPAKLKEGTEVIGVRMKVETYKSRFAQVGTKVEVEVPYEAGMDPYSGFLEIMEDLGVVKAAGAWKSVEIPGQGVKKFQSKNLDSELVKLIMSHPTIVEMETNISMLMADENSYKDEDIDNKEGDSE